MKELYELPALDTGWETTTVINNLLYPKEIMPDLTSRFKPMYDIDSDIDDWGHICYMGETDAIYHIYDKMYPQWLNTGLEFGLAGRIRR